MMTRRRDETTTTTTATIRFCVRRCAPSSAPTRGARSRSARWWWACTPTRPRRASWRSPRRTANPSRSCRVASSRRSSRTAACPPTRKTRRRTRRRRRETKKKLKTPVTCPSRGSRSSCGTWRARPAGGSRTWTSRAQTGWCIPRSRRGASGRPHRERKTSDSCSVDDASDDERQNAEKLLSYCSSPELLEDLLSERLDDHAERDGCAVTPQLHPAQLLVVLEPLHRERARRRELDHRGRVARHAPRRASEHVPVFLVQRRHELRDPRLCGRRIRVHDHRCSHEQRHAQRVERHEFDREARRGHERKRGVAQHRAWN
mmetsp:Transcript_7173/g.29683  ORF Transcript_7173/g.29683 Transcript_7173/m.29683 type:complete len:317 (-) Transcript_7173:723-1673(-)